MIRDIAAHMSEQERNDAFRIAFQNRVGVLGAEPWTISEDEARDYLSRTRVSVLLQALSQTALELKRFREELVFLDQEHTLAVFERHLAKEIERDAEDVTRIAEERWAAREANRRATAEVAA